MAFMAENVAQDRPFFCYIPYNIPHTPFSSARPVLRPVPRQPDNPCARPVRNKKTLDRTRAALALCENIDWNVGRLLGKLDDLGIAEDTIVFYFGDNGPNGARLNGGMKGTKGSADEGGVRVAG